jgi:hypothetical protein
LSTFWQITLGAVALVLITAALSLVGADTWLGVIVGAAIVGLAVGWLTRRAEQL